MKPSELQHLFWLIPGTIAGRAGPNREPWRMSEFRRAGIGAVLSVNDGEGCHPEDFARAGITYTCMPLSPNAPPRPGDLEHCLHVLPDAHAFLRAQIHHDRRVLVHCSSGKDRTCLLFAYYLMREEGCTPREAMARVRRVRPIAFSAEGWEEFVAQILSTTYESLQAPA